MVSGIRNIHLKFVDSIYKMFERDKEKVSKNLTLNLNWEEYFLHLKSNQK